MNTYDVLFILPGVLTDEAVEKTLESIRHEIERQAGTQERLDRMGRRAFARPIHKKHEGIYVRLWMRMKPEGVSPLLARLKLIEDILRVQIRRIEGDVPPPPAVPEPRRLDSEVPAQVTPDAQS